jgi:hypothetical protein
MTMFVSLSKILDLVYIWNTAKSSSANSRSRFIPKIKVLESAYRLCKELSKLMNGSVCFDDSYISEVEGCRGSRFVVGICVPPLKDDENFKTAVESDKAHPSVLILILLVEGVLATDMAQQSLLNPHLKPLLGAVTKQTVSSKPIALLCFLKTCPSCLWRRRLDATKIVHPLGENGRTHVERPAGCEW